MRMNRRKGEWLLGPACGRGQRVPGFMTALHIDFVYVEFGRVAEVCNNRGLKHCYQLEITRRSRAPLAFFGSKAPTSLAATPLENQRMPRHGHVRYKSLNLICGCKTRWKESAVADSSQDSNSHSDIVALLSPSPTLSFLKVVYFDLACTSIRSYSSINLDISTSALSVSVGVLA